jgi:hypothetical protein
MGQCKLPLNNVKVGLAAPFTSLLDHLLCSVPFGRVRTTFSGLLDQAPENGTHPFWYMEVLVVLQLL